MSYEIVLRLKAERAIDRAAEWYDKRNPDAARAFVVAVSAIIDEIRENPLQFPRIRGKLHRAILRHFPYSLVYRLTGSRVVITTCVHFRRHPRNLGVE
jgi:plasmid stabilization system protein ParE